MLKKSLLTITLLIGFSMAAFGQNDDKKEPPPKKGETPVVVPKDKEKPKDNPKPTPEKKPIKPESRFLGEIINQILIG